MNGTVAFVLALCTPAQAQDPTSSWPEVEVFSDAGTAVAELRKAPGQERVRDALARWRLVVSRVAEGGPREPIWEGLFRYDGQPRHFLVSDDGMTFVHVAEAFSSARPIVRVLREGKEIAALAGNAFDVKRAALETGAAGPSWIASGTESGETPVRMNWRETELGVWLALEIDCRDGRPRAVDLGTGQLVAEVTPAAIRVLPGVPEEVAGKLELPLVTSFSVPPFARVGATLEVDVAGDHPTPNWRLIGFETARLAGRTLEIVPRTAPPTGGPQLQVLQGFHDTVYVAGLGVGRWRIQVRGREEEPAAHADTEVLPARLFASLRISGGFAGVNQSVEVHAPGVAKVSTGLYGEQPARFETLPRADAEHIDALLRALPDSAPSRTAAYASDMFQYDLQWWKDGRWAHTRVDDLTARGPIKEMIEALRARLAP